MSVELRFVLAALAVWRVAFLLVREEGPFGVARRMRDALGRTGGGSALSCVTCAGIWIAVPFAFFVSAEPIEWFVAWLALAGVTAVLDQWLRPPFELTKASQDELLSQPDSHDH